MATPKPAAAPHAAAGLVCAVVSLALLAASVCWVYMHHLSLRGSAPALRGEVSAACGPGGYLMAPDPSGLFKDLGSSSDHDWCLAAPLPETRVHQAIWSSLEQGQKDASDAVLRSAVAAAGKQRPAVRHRHHTGSLVETTHPAALAEIQSMKTLPPMETGADGLKSFWSTIWGWLRDSANPHEDWFEKFDYAEVADKIQEASEEDRLHVPSELLGSWWVEGHPTHGSVMVSTFHWGVTRDGKGMVYNGAPSLAVDADQQNRSTLSWHMAHGLRFYFPSFQAGKMAKRTKTAVVTEMGAPFENFPLPAALYEGWSLKEAMKWDPELQPESGATCFCSLIYAGENHIERWNFGKHSYNMYRIAGPDGERTPHWERFAAFMEAQPDKQLAKMNPEAAVVSTAMDTAKFSAEKEGGRCCCGDSGCHWHSPEQLKDNGHCPTVVGSPIQANVCAHQGKTCQVDSFSPSWTKRQWSCSSTHNQRLCSQETPNFPSGRCDKVLKELEEAEVEGLSAEKEGARCCCADSGCHWHSPEQLKENGHCPMVVASPTQANVCVHPGNTCQLDSFSPSWRKRQWSCSSTHNKRRCSRDTPNFPASRCDKVLKELNEAEAASGP